jgi:hypothetical protein
MVAGVEVKAISTIHNGETCRGSDLRGVQINFR